MLLIAYPDDAINRQFRDLGDVTIRTHKARNEIIRYRFHLLTALERNGANSGSAIRLCPVHEKNETRLTASSAKEWRISNSRCPNHETNLEKGNVSKRSDFQNSVQLTEKMSFFSLCILLQELACGFLLKLSFGAIAYAVLETMSEEVRRQWEILKHGSRL